MGVHDRGALIVESGGLGIHGVQVDEDGVFGPLTLNFTVFIVNVI